VILVFSGSGVLFPAHLGFAQFVFDFFPKNQLRKSIFVGTSGGAIVASILATGMPPKEIKELAKNLLPINLISLNWKFWQPARSIGLLNLNKLENELRNYLPKTFLGYKQHFPVIVTTDLELKEAFYFSKEKTPGSDVVKTVIASCSVPFLFTPIEFGSKFLVDGGVTDNYAIDYFQGEERVFGSRILPVNNLQNTKQIIKKMYNTLDGVEESEKRKINRRVDFVVSVFEAMLNASLKKRLDSAIYAKTVKINIPFEPFDFSVTSEHIEDMFFLGYQQAKTAFERIL